MPLLTGARCDGPNCAVVGDGPSRHNDWPDSFTIIDLRQNRHLPGVPAGNGARYGFCSAECIARWATQ